MKLYVMRHCPAGAASSDMDREEWRGLTEGGENIARAIAREMLDKGEIPSVILASDYSRACQTGRIVGEILGVKVDDLDELAPSMPVQPLVAAFLADDDSKRIMLVGHSDNLDPFIAKYAGDDEPLAKGEVRRYNFDRDSGEGSLKWQLRPSDLGFIDEYDTPMAGTEEAADLVT